MVETPPERIVLDTLFYLGGVLFHIVNVLAAQLRKSCYLSGIVVRPNSQLRQPSNARTPSDLPG